MVATPATGAVHARRDLRRRVVVWRRTRQGNAVLYVASVLTVAALYYLSGRVGLELAYLDGAVAALWPPAGFGLAVLFLGGLRLWPGVVIGDLLLADLSTTAVRLRRPRRAGPGQR